MSTDDGERRAPRDAPPDREAELIWARAEPGARRARLTRDEIAAMALRIADTEGLDAVSMRRVATELGAGTMTLYYYVRNKGELLDLMHDAMMGEVLLPDDELPGDWRGALEAIARRSRDTYLRHPWTLASPPSATGPNGLRHFEQSLAAVADIAVDFPTRFEIISMVDDYVFGFLLREAEQAENSVPWSNEEWVNATAEFFGRLVATGEFPHVERVVGDKTPRATFDQLMALSADPGRFERGIARLLDGIEFDLARRGVATTPRTTST